MNSEEFVDAFKLVVRDGVTKDVISVLKSPPGRRPPQDLVKMSVFYNNLGEQEKETIEEIIKYAADGSTFGALCVLDGVRAIEASGEKGKLSLVYKKSGDSTEINEGKDLHEIYLSSQ